MKLSRSFAWKSVGLAALLGLVPGLSSCGSEEVAVGAAVVAVGAAVAAHADNDHSECRERRRCHEYWDYWGERHTECRVVERCYDHAPRAARQFTVEELRNTPAHQVIRAEELASTYYLSAENAQRFLDAVEQSRQGRIDAILALGFTEDDVEAMGRMNLRGISNASIDRMARNLNQRREMTQGMVANMINHAYRLQRELETQNGRERF
jgi:hypothetical protein